MILKSIIQKHKDSLSNPFYYLVLFALIDAYLLFSNLYTLMGPQRILNPIWISKEFFRSYFSIITNGILVIHFLSWFLFLLFPKNLKTLISATFCYGLTLAYHFSFYQLHHRHHMLLYCLIIGSFFSANLNYKHARRICTGIILSIYSLTGFWKIFYFISESKFNSNLIANLGISLQDHILATFYINLQISTFGGFFLKHTMIAGWCYLLLIIFQLSMFSFYKKEKWYRFLGIALMSFHFLNMIFLKLYFYQTIFVLFIIFLRPEEFNFKKLFSYSKQRNL